MNIHKHLKLHMITTDAILAITVLIIVIYAFIQKRK